MSQKKRLRVSQACDFCSRRSIRCQSSADDSERCQNCVDFDIPCTYDRPRRKRGQKKHESPDKSEASEAASGMSELQQPEATDAVEQTILGRAWKAFAVASEAQIHDLMTVFFEIVYPISPLFHKPTLFARLARNEHMSNRGFFASVMGACALVSARLRDGAPSWRQQTSPVLMRASPEAYVNAAKDAIPKDLTRATGLDFLRATALLALTSLQNNQVQDVHHFTGLYHTLSSLADFADEEHWPSLTLVEMEERRCLFWSFYNFEVFASVIWGRVIRNRESQSHVAYPSIIDHENITSESALNPGSWLIGWNFITDIYRLLEYAIDHSRSSLKQVTPSLGFNELQSSDDVILNRVNALYDQLPRHFKSIPQHTDQGSILGFQATSISATLALIKTVVVAADKNAGAERRCDVVEALLQIFSQIPLRFSKSMGSPLLHHISGIGAILGSIMEQPLGNALYGRVRTLLLQLTNLLESLEAGTHSAGVASERVRKQVERIDQYVSEEAHSHPRLPPSASTQAPGVNALESGTEFDNFLWHFPQEIVEWPWPMNMAGQSDPNIPPPG